MERRHDIDWLRVIAIGLLIIYHTSIAFQPWGVFIGFIQNGESLEWIWVPMSMLNMWRIPILFFVSGMGVHFAMRKRNFWELIFERSQRILLPFVFGIIAIVPLHIFLWQDYYQQDLTYQPSKGHLWFLGNIYTYVIILAPLFYTLRKLNLATRYTKLENTLKHPFIFLLVSLSFVLETLIAQPELYTFYAISWHGYFMGLLSFFFGYLFIHLGESFWKGLYSWKWAYLVLASMLYLLRIFVYDLEAPLALMALESVAWIFSILGLFHQFINQPGKVLNYLSQAAYPIYIIHMLVLYGVSYFLFPLDIPVLIKLALVIFTTFIGCFLIYELLIKRLSYIRPLFGLKISNHPNKFYKKIFRKMKTT